MASYFDTFGIPEMSIHMINRLRERDISLTALTGALRTEPRPGTAAGTIMYRSGGVSVVVNAVSGRIITVWQE